MLKDRPRPQRLIRAGIIRLGHKEKKVKKDRNGREYEVEYPVQDDHFVLTDAPKIAAVYGESVTELDVLLPFPDAARNFDAAYQVWAGGVLVCRGDGEYVQAANPFRVDRNDDGKVTAVRNAPGDTLVSNGLAQCAFNWNGQEFNPGDHVPCPGSQQADRYPHCAVCKASSMLKVMMVRPELLRLAYYQVSTRSMRNYETILGTLLAIQDEYGKVSGIHYHLRLVKQPTTYKDASGTRRKTERWFLELEPYPEDLLALVRKRLASHLALPEPEVEEALEGEAEVEDFEAEEPAPPPFAEEGGPAEAPEPDEPGEEAEEGRNTVPTRPQALLAWINNHREDPYDNLFHLLNALKAELGKDWNWPTARDVEGWAQAKDAAMRHKRGGKHAQAELALEEGRDG